MTQFSLRVFIPRRQIFLLFVSFALMQFVLWGVSTRAFAQTFPPPKISNVNILTPSVARFEKFELGFDVETSASHLSLPFDANPPPGLTPGMGVSVDALFSNDNWKTTLIQPAFLYQPYAYEYIQTRDHWIPNGAPHWLVRFAPRSAGDYQVRLRVTDQGGTTMYPEKGALEFHVHEGGVTRYDGMRENPYTRHGFLRVSQSDPRYFEFEDGTPFVGLGYKAGSESIDFVKARYRAWQVNGLQFARVWMSGEGINASQWTPWAFPKQPYSHSLPDTSLAAASPFPGSDFSYRLAPDRQCLFADFWQRGISVQPSATYSVTVRARVNQLKPIAGATDAGFTLMQGGFPENGCASINGTPIIPYQIGTTNWFTLTGQIQTAPNQQYLNFLYLMLKNVEQGQAFIDSVTLVKTDDPNRVDLLRHGEADSHLFFDSMNAAKWDLLIQQAEEHGVYLKIVADEKNEWIRNVIQKDGTLGKFDNNNFYASDNSKVRWLDEAWWRYLIARWGYSTAIHSFEFINEGDPYNGNHYNAANAMARYFDEHDPSQHMVTTSFWTSFPNTEFWSNPLYNAVDYADIHAYITTGWGNNASFVPPANLDTTNQFDGANSFHISGKQEIRKAIHPRGVTLNEPGEWTIRYWLKLKDFQAQCGFGEGGSAVRVYWLLDDKRQGVVPNNPDGKHFLCTSPDGTFDWRAFDSQHDRDGKELPISERLVLTDTVPHELELGVQNTRGVSGDAWIANVELISPSGVRVPVIGTFDNTLFADDSAWWSAAYSLLWGGASPVGAHKPLVRGETGLNSAEFPDGLPTLNQDREGIWLHNFVWAQINAGGMYDLWWFAPQNIEDNPNSGRTGNLLPVYLPFANFMADVPLNNGAYQDANATASDDGLRVWGQRDTKNGRAHLWIQNTAHTWKNVVEGQAAEPRGGTISLPMPAGTYRVEWWDPYRANDAVFKTDQVTANGTLTVTLPAPLATDTALKITRIVGAE